MRRTILTIGVTLAMTALATGVAADDLVSVSGECYSEDYSEGGTAHLAVTEDGQVNENGVITDGEGNLDPAQSGGAVDAATYFGVRSAESSPGEACDGPSPEEDPDRNHDDYLAVTAGPVMICYDGAPNLWTSPSAWGCPSRPDGAPDS